MEEKKEFAGICIDRTSLSQDVTVLKQYIQCAVNPSPFLPHLEGITFQKSLVVHLHWLSHHCIIHTGFLLLPMAVQVILV